MRIVKNPLKTCLIGLLTWGMGAAFAVAAMDDAPAPEAGNYLNGGIGVDGRQAMHAERRNYNLRLAFAQAHSGEFLAGLVVTIQRLGSNEAPVRYDDCGPLFYVKLEPGRYHISAEYEGRTQQLSTTVSAKGVDRVMYWR